MNTFVFKNSTKILRRQEQHGKRFVSNIQNESFASTKIKSFEEIPGPKSLPVIGTLWKYLPYIGEYSFDKIHHNGLRKLKSYGPIVREEIIPGVNIIWITSPDDIRIMFQNEGRYPQRRSHLALAKFREDRPNVYNTAGLLATNGSEWSRIRKPIQKYLSRPQNIKTYISATNAIIDEFCLRIKNVYNSNVIEDFNEELSRLFLELICLVAFDVQMSSFSDEEMLPSSRSSRLLKSAFQTNGCILKTDNGLHLWKKFNTPLYSKLEEAQIFMEKIAVEFVSKKSQSLKKLQINNSDNLSLLEQFLLSNELDYKDIIGFACDMLLAGVDTTSYSTSFAVYHLANNPRVQDRIYEESKHMLPNFNSVCTSEILEEAKYTKAVLKESLRLNPISIGVGRILEQDVVLSGCFVPKGTVIVTENQVACRLTQYFTQPEKFIPERWIKTQPNYECVHPYLLLPFGHGPRSCVARRLAEQNMHILLLKIVRNFKLKWKGNSKLDTKSLLINKPDGKITLQLIPRTI